MEVIKNIYKKNETMQLLGKQRSADPFWHNDEVMRQLDQVSEGRPYQFTAEAASDIFMLGYIHGKRAERARKRKAV